MFEISARDARRVSLQAQGFTDSIPKGPIGPRDFKKAMTKMNVIQLDSVQAVCRSHYLPMYSRLGVYEQADLDRWLWHSGKTFETWSHEASVVQVELEPSLRWMKRQARKGATWAGLHKMAKQKSGYIAGVLAEVQQNGPINASSRRDPRPRKGQWWDGRSDGTRRRRRARRRCAATPGAPRARTPHSRSSAGRPCLQEVEGGEMLRILRTA